MIAIIIEWKGPRCSTYGINMSMSGITESVKMRGMFILVLVACAVNLPKTYPRAKCPTANVFPKAITLYVLALSNFP